MAKKPSDAARDLIKIAERHAKEKQQAFDNQMQMAEMQMRAAQMDAQQNAVMQQNQFNQLGNIAGAFGGLAGSLFGGAIQERGVAYTQGPPRDSDEAARAAAYRNYQAILPDSSNLTIRQILQAEIDLWLAPVTL